MVSSERIEGRNEGLDAAVRVIESRYPYADDQMRGFLSVLVEGIRAMKQPPPKDTP